MYRSGLQRNKNRSVSECVRVCVCVCVCVCLYLTTERKGEIYFKQLVYATVEADKSEICRYASGLKTQKRFLCYS